LRTKIVELLLEPMEIVEHQHERGRRRRHRQRRLADQLGQTARRRRRQLGGAASATTRLAVIACSSWVSSGARAISGREAAGMISFCWKRSAIASCQLSIANCLFQHRSENRTAQREPDRRTENRRSFFIRGCARGHWVSDN